MHVQKVTKIGTQCLGYSWATLSPGGGGVINKDTWSSRLRLGAGQKIQPRKKVTIKKPQNGDWAVEPYDGDFEIFPLITCLQSWVWEILRRWSACAPTAWPAIADSFRFTGVVIVRQFRP
jgi:hypothetical protein